MSDESDQKVSREAHDRVTRERDELKAQLADLQATVKDMGVRDKARQVFREKGVADPDWAADFALPHLRNVAFEELPSFIEESPAFAPIFSMGQQAASSESEVPTDPGPGVTRGPNPGGRNADDAKLPPVTREEYQRAIDANDMSTINRWVSEGRLAMPVRVEANR